MLSFSSGKAADNQQKNSTELTTAPDNAQTQVVTSTQDVIVQVTPPVEDEKWEVEGIEEAIKELKKKCPLPEVSATNALLVTSAALTATVAVTDTVYEEGGSSVPALAVSGLNLASSGMMQLKEYYDKHTNIQALQHKFIEEIVKIGLVARCYHESASGIITKTLTELTSANIIKFLYENTCATIELASIDRSFTLRNNGVFSLRLGGAAVASVAATAISTGIFVASQSLASQAVEAASYAPTMSPSMSPTMMSGEGPAISANASLAVTALIVSSLPFLKLWGGFVRVLYNQELNLLQAMKLVTDNFYKGFNNFGKLPKTFLSLFTGYISPEIMESNRDKINVWGQKKADLRVDRLESQVKELQEKFEQQQVVGNGDDNNQEDERTVLLSNRKLKG